MKNKDMQPWKILIVDDEPDICAITRLSLKKFHYLERPLTILEAGSGQQARQVFSKTADIAMAIIDVVMETSEAGLELVRFIREELEDTDIRLIIRTGQAGGAPERYVIDNYDIDDYRDKTELTAQKLYSLVRSSLKSYHDLQVVKAQKETIAQTYKQLLHNGKLAATGKLASSICHEFGSPIFGIRNILKELIAQDTLPRHSNELLAMGVSECERLSRLLDNLRGLSRPSNHVISAVQLEELVAKALTLMQKPFRDNQVQVHSDIANLPPVEAVADQLLQVLLNLLANAVDACGDHGGEIHITAEASPEQVEVAIRDTGKGISSQEQQNIFKPFFSTKDQEEGTGLGLSICDGIMSCHGGTITVASDQGVGTTFFLSLPLTQQHDTPLFEA